MTGRERVLAAMPRGEWLRTQWIARVAFDAPPPVSHVRPTQRARAVLKALERDGLVESRLVEVRREGVVAGVRMAFPILRTEWRRAS